MSQPDVTAEDLELPIKRTDGDTLAERLTSNAYDNILPARYLRKDADGNVTEQQEELFERVAHNIALAEAVYEADRRDTEVTVTPDQVKPGHPRRDELAAEVFGAGTTTDDDVETALTEANVNKFAYETVVPELPGEIAQHVQETAAEFRDLMERLAFMPNSPTLMNAGDELQQLSACIAGHAPVYTREGLKRMDEVEPGDEVLTHEGRYKPVVDHWSNGEKSTIEMRRGIERGTCFDTQLTPDHEVYTADGEWVRADEVQTPADPTFPTDEPCPELIDLTQYTGHLKKQKPVTVDDGRVKLKNADDPRTPEFDQQNNQPTAHVVNDEKLAWLFGLYLAEGDVYGSDLRFTVGMDETDLRDRLVSTLESVFETPVSVSESSHGRWVQIRLSSSFVADLFASVLGVGGDQKRIPNWVGDADGSYQQALLDGLLVGDGTDLETGNKLALANPTLVYEATLLARSLGYDAVFKQDKQRDLSSGPTSECYISTAERSRLSNVARREAESVEVYDMEVEDDHSFVVGDFVVHNCFVDSPADDIDDIHQTAKEAAQVFQCLTEESTVVVEGEGPVSVSEVEAGDRVAQQTESGFQFKPVEETHSYEDAETLTVSLTNGLDVRGTPNHRLLVDGEWTRLDEIRAGQEVHYALGWLRETTRETPTLTSVESGGRDPGSTSFDESEALELYEQGHSDATVAEELGVSTASVARLRAREQLAPNGTPVKTVQQPERLTEDLAELVGLWVGDGSAHEDGVRFHVGRESVADYVDELSRQLFGTDTSVSFAEGCYEVTINSHEIKRWWEANFDCKPNGAQSARVPQTVKRAPAEVVRAFLRGYFTADGTLLDDTYPKLYSSSERAIDDVATLMMGLGYPVKKSVVRDEDAHPYYGLVPTTGDGREAFLREVGFVDERREIGLANAESVTARDSHTVGEEYTVTVDAVTESDPATVYDITVADNHEYVTDGIVSHNSGGGMGYAFWQLRPYGDPVGSTGGIASGPITFMRTFDQMCETIAQGGARRGAQMGVMRVSHPDVIQFIHAKNKDVSLARSLRLNDPDDFTHTSFADALEEARELIDDDGKVPEHLRNAVEGHLSNFNISVGITDDFMEAVKNDEEFTFTNPRTEEPHVATHETKELYEMFGLGEHVEVGEELSVPAAEIWDHIVQGAHENGEPGVVYLERINEKHSFDVDEHPDHQILATNPCFTGDTEVLTGNGESVPIRTLADRDEVTVAARTDDTPAVVSEARAESVRRTREDAEIVRVVTEQGPSVECTPDHEFWTGDGYRAAADLTPGDTVRGTTTTDVTFPAEHDDLTVAYTESAGTADVYDLKVPEYHNFHVAGDGDGWFNVHNCGEQPLEEYEACNLGHINLSTLAAQDAPDWRVWSEEHEFDTLEEGVERFLREAVDFEEFDHRIQTGTRFLENVVTMSDFPVDEIADTVASMRKIGLGIMGLAQLYIQLGVKYGDEVANEIAEQLMTHINHESKTASHELAEERGSFAEWDDSKYADPTAYREWFEHHTGEDADEWADGFSIRNHNTTTIAPTGTTSMVGNTTGGCEPIYNVAYYKNVSDDVQGDEMLVEFDDYFLRTLEANDVDVEAVKREAQEQMAANEFDGVDGLETVPDAIGELFVVTGDLDAKDHAGVQVACQAGVDSAISKTVNAPNDSTLEDAREVFEYIYDHGGKGVTYYRDGTRSKQVLTTRADNTEFADETEAAETIVQQIGEVFGGVEAFLDSEDVQAAVDAEIDELLAASERPQVDYTEKRPRPDSLTGVTQLIETGYGKMYVTINEDPQTGEPFELFANIGHSGGFTNSFTESLAKVISTALRSGVDPAEIVDELQGTRSPKVAWDKGEQIQSIPDAIGTAMRRYLDGEIDRAHPEQQNLGEIDDGEPGADTGAEPEPPTQSDGGVAAEATTEAVEDLIANGESPECPECGSMTLYYSEGCKTCESCGWSEC